MGQKMYNVTIQGITKQYPEKIPYSEIVKEYEGSTDAPVMLVIVNGRLRELHKHLKADCEIEFVLDEKTRQITATCRTSCVGKTGVEMEAMTGVSVALLTIYDMCKAIDRGMVISEIHLVEKMGGKSGHYRNENG